MTQQVFEPTSLCFGLGADHDRREAPRPDLVAPADQAPDLAGEVGVEVTHEVPELLRVADAEQAMVVVPEDHHGHNAYVVDPLRTAEDTEDDLVGGRARTQEKTALDGPGRDLDEGSPLGDEA